mmetsp:Transcript_1623/g.4204  ORF Transcript_1623/g.4204 Transcript_1623/m.4204 type:complete len:366 (-) Transcript_1623:84-1181(-)
MLTTIHTVLLLASLQHGIAHRGEAEEATFSLLETGSATASGTQVTSSMLLADCNTENLATRSSQAETVAWMQHCVDTLHSYYQQAKRMEWSSRDANQRYASDIELVKSVLRQLQSRAGIHSDYFQAFRADEKNVVHQLLHRLDKVSGSKPSMVEVSANQTGKTRVHAQLGKHHQSGAPTLKHKHRHGRILSANLQNSPERAPTSSIAREGIVGFHADGFAPAQRLASVSPSHVREPMIVRPSPVVADESDDDGQHVRADASDARVKDVEDEVRPSAIASAPTYAGSQAEDFDDALTRKHDALSSFLRQTIIQGLHEDEASTIEEQGLPAEDQEIFGPLSPTVAMDQAMDQVRAVFPDVVLSETAS